MKLSLSKTILFFAISGAVLPASAAERLTVKVPFSFVVGDAKMNAGDYTITQQNNGMVTLMGTKTSAMVLTVPGDYAKGSTSALNFNSAASQPVLTSIQVSGALTREIPAHLERKVALISAR